MRRKSKATLYWKVDWIKGHELVFFFGKKEDLSDSVMLRTKIKALGSIKAVEDSVREAITFHTGKKHFDLFRIT